MKKTDMCRGRTAKGEPCKRKAQPGAKFCATHAKVGKGELGRPTKYRADKHDDLVKAHASSPKTDAQIAEAMEISYGTLRNWLSEHPTFLASHKEGREELLDQSVMSLYKRALGYDYVSVKVERVAPPDKDYIQLRTLGLIDPKTGLITKLTESTVHVPAEVGAAVFVVCNRRRNDWRHVQRIEVTGADGGAIQHDHQFQSIDEVNAALATVDADYARLCAAATDGDQAGHPAGKKPPAARG